LRGADGLLQVFGGEIHYLKISVLGTQRKYLELGLPIQERPKVILKTTQILFDVLYVR